MGSPTSSPDLQPQGCGLPCGELGTLQGLMLELGGGWAVQLAAEPAWLDPFVVADLSLAGWRPISSSAYGQYPFERYVVVWRMLPGAPDFRLALRMVAGDVEPVNAAMAAGGYYPSAIAAVAGDGEPRFAQIFVAGQLVDGAVPSWTPVVGKGYGFLEALCTMVRRTQVLTSAAVWGAPSGHERFAMVLRRFKRPNEVYWNFSTAWNVAEAARQHAAQAAGRVRAHAVAVSETGYHLSIWHDDYLRGYQPPLLDVPAEPHDGVFGIEQVLIAAAFGAPVRYPVWLGAHQTEAGLRYSLILAADHRPLERELTVRRLQVLKSPLAMFELSDSLAEGGAEAPEGAQPPAPPKPGPPALHIAWPALHVTSGGPAPG